MLDLAVTEEGLPSLGRDGSTYQEYIVPAFLTQVNELDAVAVVGVDVVVDAVDHALVEMVLLYQEYIVPAFLTQI